MPKSKITEELLDEIEEKDSLLKLLAIDPGDKHVGLAWFQVDRKWASEPEQWRCTDTQEVTPDELKEALLETLTDHEVDVIVYERFLLDPTKLQAQINSEMETPQLIGVIKYIVDVHNRHARRHQEHPNRDSEVWSPLNCMLPSGVCYDRPDRWLAREVKLVGQTPSIKKPTRGILNKKKIKSVAAQNKDRLGHQKDAELHGYYYVYNGQYNN